MLKRFGRFLKEKKGLWRGGSAQGLRTWVPPGHFYSPIPNMKEVKDKEDEIWGKGPGDIKGIDLNAEGQLRLLDVFSKYYKELPFGDEKRTNLRYYFKNDSYSYSDAIFLYSMMRHFKPRRIIEVGSGYSSCVMLDANELFFGNGIECKFIEPFPELFLSLIKEGDRKKIELFSSNLQDVDIKIFTELQPNDFLFIDSTHVSKTGSDVNHIFFEILPVLNKGVYIHFHDIFFPFEYPREWVYEGRAWNEAYILMAFLQYNPGFQITLFNTFLFKFYRDIIEEKLPLCSNNPGGSIWIKKC